MIHIETDNLGEVRMGCSELEFKIQPPIPGFTKFSTINGEAFYDVNHRVLIVCDGCMVLLFDEQSQTFYYYDVTSKFEKTFLSTVKVVGDQLELLLNTKGKESKVYLNISPIDVQFQKGVGGVNQNGKFPSAQMI